MATAVEIDVPPRPLSLVKFMWDSLPEEYHKTFPWVAEKEATMVTPILFLGEIPNMPGHCVVMYKDQILVGYHTSDFAELTEDEV